MLSKNKSPPIQTFNDGVLSVYTIERDGIKDIPGKLKHNLLRYAERTVGLNRFYKGKQANVEISMLVRIQRQNDISTQDAVKTADGRLFYVRQVQYPADVVPPCCDLSLERWVPDYDAERV